MSKIWISNENRMIEAREGETLLSALRRSGIALDAPCGGQGRCGKCRVRVEGAGEVLSCCTRARDGMRVDTSGAALDQASAQILTEAFLGDAPCREPLQTGMIRYGRIEVPPCPPGKSVSDWARLTKAAAAAGLASPGGLDPDPSIASLIGPELKKALREHQSRELYAAVSRGRILRLSSEEFPVLAAAFDIGTTTVAGYLLDAKTGKTLTTASCMNPQAQYGADVIARANYTLEQGMEPVSRCIRQALNGLLEEMAAQAGILQTDILLISIAGNTCMHHLFLGISVDSLVHAPYNPAISDPMVLRAAHYGLQAHERAHLAMLPNIAGFVGADTVACLVSSRLAEQEEWTLLIDIGTNGEMVLGRSHRMAACSTAAGPAFEGAGISCGMRGAAGAISKAVWAEDHWEFEVIGGGKVRGICGSGLLDVTAQLLASGQMDETGDMEIDDILLAPPERSASGAEIRLLKKDIRQLQLAKAAIATGLKLLARKLGVRLDEIRQVWLAGAFGSFLSPESACTIGLIPPELRGRIRPIGNAAGEGAREVLRSEKLWDYAAVIAAETEFLELASMPEFNDTFIDEIMFPEE